MNKPFHLVRILGRARHSVRADIHSPRSGAPGVSRPTTGHWPLAARTWLLITDHRLLCLSLLLVIAGAGCRSIGPGTVPRDRSDYSSSIGDSWKRQTLLNIVKLRYVDPPIFVDVGQIVAGYQFSTSANVGAGWASASSVTPSRALTVGVQGLYTDRPTITYVPMTGNKFVKGLMTPLPPESVFFTIQSGWPADGVLFASVASLNGLKNQDSSIAGVTPPDPGFLRVLQLMRQIQLSGAVAFRIKQDEQKQQTAILAFRSKDMPPQTLDDIHELRRLLRLDPDAEELKLVFAGAPASDHEIAVITRSLMQQMATMASDVEVPPEDEAQGRAIPGWDSISGNTNAVRLIQIKCSKSEPTDNAFVTVEYRHHWFWIDDRDLKSKRVFSFMMMLFTLADTGEKENLPLITIPAQ
jgi:hypothetical protein